MLKAYKLDLVRYTNDIILVHMFYLGQIASAYVNIDKKLFVKKIYTHCKKNSHNSEDFQELYPDIKTHVKKTHET